LPIRSETKVENSGGEGGLAILEFGGQGGDKHFGISEGMGGLKYLCRPWYGMDIFWNHPMPSLDPAGMLVKNQ